LGGDCRVDVITSIPTSQTLLSQRKTYFSWAFSKFSHQALLFILYCPIVTIEGTHDTRFLPSKKFCAFFLLNFSFVNYVAATCGSNSNVPTQFCCMLKQ